MLQLILFTKFSIDYLLVTIFACSLVISKDDLFANLVDFLFALADASNFVDPAKIRSDRCVTLW